MYNIRITNSPEDAIPDGFGITLEQVRHTYSYTAASSLRGGNLASASFDGHVVHPVPVGQSRI